MRISLLTQPGCLTLIAGERLMTTRPSVLVANRGEVAVRIMRAACELGWRCCAVYTDDDPLTSHLRMADEAVRLRGSGPKAYMDAAALVGAAVELGCGFLHPGYGFLSESAELAGRCTEAGVRFVGPDQPTLALFVDKLAARQLAFGQGVPVLAVSGPLASSEQAREFFASLGQGAGVMVKAVGGGGGRGMREVFAIDQLDEAVRRSSSEARAGFGTGEVFVERLMTKARHLEVQIVGDGSRVTHLGVRDCSIQRRHQKILEIAPAQRVDEALARKLTAAATKMARAVGYKGLCTFEFLAPIEPETEGEELVFLEVNPRLQVEHTVTEEIFDLDLVVAQLMIVSGSTLADLHLRQEDLAEPHGIALEARVNSEVLLASGELTGSAGRITRFEAPTGPGVRTDTAAFSGCEISPSFDPLLAKVICHARFGGLDAASAMLAQALTELKVEGVQTNVSTLIGILSHPKFQAGEIDTGFLERNWDALGSKDAQEPKDGHRVRSSYVIAGSTQSHSVFAHGVVPVEAPLAGTVSTVAVSTGDAVKTGAELAVVESMKMEHVIRAPCAGTVERVEIGAGDLISEGDQIFLISGMQAGYGATEDCEAIDLEVIRPEVSELYRRKLMIEDDGRPEAVERRHRSGRRTSRENVYDLCEKDSFVEYGALAIAAQRQRRSVQDLIEATPADGLIAGVGRVNGLLFGPHRSRCAILAYDYTVLAGTQGQRNHRKKDRVLELAGRHNLPVVLFAEGGGGRPGDTDADVVTGLDAMAFRLFAELSGRVPLVGVVSGRCFAGNAALLGCCDVIIATPDANIGMGGPAMIEGAGLGIYEPEEIGPVDVQQRNGVIDVVVSDEPAAVSTAKKYLSYFQGCLDSWDCEDQRLLRTVVPQNRVRAYDIRRAVEVIFDTGSVLELRAGFGVGMITSLARLEGMPVGVLANNPLHLGGAIDSQGADKAARFLQLCDAFHLPVIVLCDTPGFMVGPDAERTAQVRHFSRMFVAAGAMAVPNVTIILRKGYGLGAMAMAAGSFRSPVSTVSWPTGELGPMGLEGAVRLGFARELASVADPSEREELFASMVQAAYENGKALNVATYMEIDDVIDPAATRAQIVNVLSHIDWDRPRTPMDQLSRRQSRRFVDTW